MIIIDNERFNYRKHQFEWFIAPYFTFDDVYDRIWYSLHSRFSNKELEDVYTVEIDEIYKIGERYFNANSDDIDLRFDSEMIKEIVAHLERCLTIDNDINST